MSEKIETIYKYLRDVNKVKVPEIKQTLNTLHTIVITFKLPTSVLRNY